MSAVMWDGMKLMEAACEEAARVSAAMEFRICVFMVGVSVGA